MVEWGEVSWPKAKGPINNDTDKNRTLDAAMDIAGVYVIYIKKGDKTKARYIGRAVNIKDRMHEYERFEGHTEEFKKWLEDNIYSGDVGAFYTEITTEAERERIECHLIRHYDKTFNLLNKRIPDECDGKFDIEPPF